MARNKDIYLIVDDLNRVQELKGIERGKNHD
jgi:hypothetical protein